MDALWEGLLSGEVSDSLWYLLCDSEGYPLFPDVATEGNRQ